MVCRQIQREMSHPDRCSRLAIDLLGEELAIRLFRQHSNLSGSSMFATTPGPGYRDWRLRRAIEYLETHLGDDLRLNEVAAVAHEQGWSTHMDGARLMNACVAAGVAPKDMVASYDSVWLDFTKGLGAPLGAVLCGSAEFIDRAWRWKQRLGGSMRQAGICAAACLYSLDHHVDRLAEDHANARALARGLGQIEGVVVEEPDTNLVFFDVKGAGCDVPTLQSRLAMQGVSVSGLGGRVRACTHLDVTAPMIEEAVGLIRQALHA